MRFTRRGLHSLRFVDPLQLLASGARFDTAMALSLQIVTEWGVPVPRDDRWRVRVRGEKFPIPLGYRVLRLFSCDSDTYSIVSVSIGTCADTGAPSYTAENVPAAMWQAAGGAPPSGRSVAGSACTDAHATTCLQRFLKPTGIPHPTGTRLLFDTHAFTSHWRDSGECLVL